MILSVRYNGLNPTIVCLGDSITYGYPLGPNFSWVERVQKLSKLNLINEGVNGDTTKDMLYRFNEDVLLWSPTHVQILGGINDAWEELDMYESQLSIRSMIELSVNHDIIPIIGITTPICTNPVGQGVFLRLGIEKIKDWLARFRQWLQEYASLQSIPLINYYTPLALPNVDNGDENFFYDECHLNEKGYDMMATVAKSSLLNILEQGT